MWGIWRLYLVILLQAHSQNDVALNSILKQINRLLKYFSDHMVWHVLLINNLVANKLENSIISHEVDSLIVNKMVSYSAYHEHGMWSKFDHMFRICMQWYNVLGYLMGAKAWKLVSNINLHMCLKKVVDFHLVQCWFPQLLIMVHKDVGLYLSLMYVGNKSRDWIHFLLLVLWMWGSGC